MAFILNSFLVNNIGTGAAFNTVPLGASSLSDVDSLGQALGQALSGCGLRLAERAPRLGLLNDGVQSPNGKHRQANQRQRHTET